MDWVVDLSEKLQALLDIEGLTAMQEDAFDFVEHQLQTVGNSIENQFQTVSANIENQLQTIRANIDQYCSSSDLNGSEQIDAENTNFEPAALINSAHSLELFEQESKLADVENDNINSTAQESSMIITKSNSGKAVEDSSSFLDDSDFEYSKLADEESEVTEPTCSDSSMKHGKVIGPNDEEPRLDEIYDVVDTDGLCSRCLGIFESDPDKERICDACAGKSKLIDQQEQERPAPESQAIDNGSHLSEDESFYSDDADCDSDWEII